jgi:hypothetical protein
VTVALPLLSRGAQFSPAADTPVAASYRVVCPEHLIATLATLAVRRGVSTSSHVTSVAARSGVEPTLLRTSETVHESPKCLP